MNGDLYIIAESSNSTYDNPRWCRIPAAHIVPLLCELSRCRQIVQKYNIGGVHTQFNIASWGPTAIAEDLGICGVELVVGPKRFLLRSWPEGLAPVETIYLPIDGFETAVRDGTRHFVGDPRPANDEATRDEINLLAAEIKDDEARQDAEMAA